MERRISRIYNDFIENLELSTPISRESFFNNLLNDQNFKFITQHFNEIRQKYPFTFRSNRQLYEIKLATNLMFFNIYNLRDIEKYCDFEFREKKDPNEADYFEITINEEYENIKTNNNRYNTDDFENESRINNETEHKKNRDNEWSQTNEWNEENAEKKNKINDINFTGWGDEKIKYSGSDLENEENKKNNKYGYGKVYVSEKFDDRNDSSNEFNNRDRANQRKYKIDQNLIRNLRIIPKEKPTKIEDQNNTTIINIEKNDRKESPKNEQIKLKEENKNSKTNIEEKEKNKYLEKKREKPTEDANNTTKVQGETVNNIFDKSYKDMKINIEEIKKGESKKSKNKAKMKDKNIENNLTEPDKAAEIINLSESSSSEEENNKKSGIQTTVKLSKKTIKNKFLEQLNKTENTEKMNENGEQKMIIEKNEDNKRSDRLNNKDTKEKLMELDDLKKITNKTNDKDEQEKMKKLDEQKNKSKNINIIDNQTKMNELDEQKRKTNKTNEKDKQKKMNELDEQKTKTNKINKINEKEKINEIEEQKNKTKEINKTNKHEKINQLEEQKNKTNNTNKIDEQEKKNEMDELKNKSNKTNEKDKHEKTNQLDEQKNKTKIINIIDNKENMNEKDQAIETTKKNETINENKSYSQIECTKKMNENNKQNDIIATVIQRNDNTKIIYRESDYEFNVFQLLIKNQRINKDKIIFFTGYKNDINRNILKIDIPDDIKEDGNTFLKMLLMLSGINPMFHPVLRKLIYKDLCEDKFLINTINQYHLIDDIRNIVKKDQPIIPIFAIPFGKKHGIGIFYQYNQHSVKFLEGLKNNYNIILVVYRRKVDKNISNEYLYDYYMAYKNNFDFPFELNETMKKVIMDNIYMMIDE